MRFIPMIIMGAALLLLVGRLRTAAKRKAVLYLLAVVLCGAGLALTARKAFLPDIVMPGAGLTHEITWQGKLYAPAFGVPQRRGAMYQVAYLKHQVNRAAPLQESFWPVRVYAYRDDPEQNRLYISGWRVQGEYERVE